MEGCLAIILFLAIGYFLGGAFIYFLYNILLAWAFPTIPQITFFQCAIVAIVLGFIRGGGK